MTKWTTGQPSDGKQEKSVFFKSRMVKATGNRDVKTHRLYACTESMDKTNTELMNGCYTSTREHNFIKE